MFRNSILIAAVLALAATTGCGLSDIDAAQDTIEEARRIDVANRRALQKMTPAERRTHRRKAYRENMAAHSAFM